VRDRELIREILVDRRAPRCDLEHLVEMYTESEAREYVAPQGFVTTGESARKP
jgi:hypothetical protein